MKNDRPLRLGRIVGTRRTLALSEEQRATHLHIIGASGTGKSTFMESLIRQDIVEGRGLCLIDPHGDLAQRLLAWASALPVPPRKLHYIAPHRDDYTICYNLFRKARPDQDSHFLVTAMKLAAVKVWGADNTLQTPRLDVWLEHLFLTAVTLGMTLPEVGMLLDPIPDRNPLREWVADRLPAQASATSMALMEICRLVERRPADLDAQIGSTSRRLSKFLSNPRLRRIYGVPDVSLDLAAAMDERAILLVDLSPQGALHPDDAKFFGTMMLSDFYLQMFNRKRRDRPFTLFIDEFQMFANNDLTRMLDEARKFGLRLALAHQRPAQLSESADDTDRKLYSAVMTNARTKIVFGGIDPKELEPIARNISLGVLDPDKVKLEIRNPAVVGYAKEYWEAHSRGSSHTTTTGSGGSAGSGSVQGSSSGGAHAETFDPNRGLFGPKQMFTAESSSWQSHFGKSDFSGESWMDAVSDSESEGTTVFPTLVPQMADQLSAVYYRSLDEQLFQFMAILNDQQQRQAMVRVVGQKEPIPIETPTLKPPPDRPKAVERQLALSFTRENGFLPASEADAIIERRRLALERIAAPRPEEPEDLASSAAPHATIQEADSLPKSMTDAPIAAPKVGGVQLQPRDLTMLADLFECRLITIRQAAALYFDGKEDAAKQRLLKLHGAGLLDKRPLGVSAPDGSRTAYFFQKAALDLLMELGQLARYNSREWDSKLRKRFAPSEITIKHEIAVMNVKARLQPAINGTEGMRVLHFGVWPLGYEFEVMRQGRPTTVQPDGYVHVADHRRHTEGRYHRFYLELDRGTETLDTVALKAEGYRDHYRSGGFRAWLRRPASEPIKAHPFLVLVVAPSAARRDNICERLLEARVAKQVWLTTQGEIEGGPLEAIWTFPRLFQADGMTARRKLALFDDPSELFGDLADERE